jgi:N-acetylneuraminic acid mutarotase
MKKRIVIAASQLLLVLVIASQVSAQVPQLINYQGRVAVSGVNFTGAGQFGFALVDTTGATTFWSNDGTSAAGSQPTTAVSLTVTNGLYSVLLGDTTLTNMTAIPASVFSNTDVRLRVWFNDGAHGFQLLTPDQRIAAVGYAIMAGNVPDGSITSAKIAAGSITSAHLAPGAAAANLAASGQAGVPGGGVILSATENAALVSAGYLRIGTIAISGNAWQQQLNGTPPSARSSHTAVWTGTEMIVWGGYDGNSYCGDGRRFIPSTGTWTAISTIGAPAGRAAHTAVWTGSEMIVWGGQGSVDFNDGGRYNPAAGTWTAVTTTGAPAGRCLHTAVWTGGEMIVWGGSSGNGLNDGGRYNPAAGTWTAVTTTGAPAARARHNAVWTGFEMIVWGGQGAVDFNDGGRYNPTAGTWTAVTTTGAPAARQISTAVWTGTEMIVWGGLGSGGGGPLNDGGRYNPASGTWTAVTTTGAPTARLFHTAVWTGTEMILWGGNDYSVNYFNDGGRYNPVAGTWTAVAATGAPMARDQHTAVWTGTEMIIWGGVNWNSVTYWNYLNDTWSYTPDRVMVLYQKL